MPTTILLRWLEIVLLSLWPGSLMADYPAHTDDFVNDFAHVLQPADSHRLRLALRKLEQQTGVEGVVVTVTSIAAYGTGDNDIESFATHLFNKWGVGHKEKNDGFMVIVSVDDRACRIELGGSYPRQYNSRMKDIIDKTMLPLLKGGDFSRAIADGTDQVIDGVTEKVSWLEFHKWQVVLGVVALLFFLAGVDSLLRGKTGWGWLLISISSGLLILLIKSIFSTREEPGFGGGHSDGGGASGRW